MVLLLVVLPLQLEGIRGRSGYSEVALVSFRGLETREAGCVAVVERGGDRGQGELRQKLFAVDGCRVHANCHQKDAEHVPVCPLCKHAQHASLPLPLLPLPCYCAPLICMRAADWSSEGFFLLRLRCCPNVFAKWQTAGQKQLPLGIKGATRVSVPLPPPPHHFLFLPFPSLTAPRSRPANIHFELLNFEKVTRAKTDIIFEDSGCSRSKKNE